VIRRGSIADSDAVEALEATMTVNLGGTVNMIRACLPHLAARQGRIVNIASIQAFISLPNSFAYTASKGAVLQLTRALAQELAPSGIRVNAIAPGGIATPLNAPTRAKPGYVEEFLKRVPLKRFGEPSDLAGPVVFLSSAMSAYVNGVCLPVDGGFLAV
jgi:NAD(P)-dependent dehydrogenase (short-subunit alcohol dehydrogenase family)